MGPKSAAAAAAAPHTARMRELDEEARRLARECADHLRAISQRDDDLQARPCWGLYEKTLIIQLRSDGTDNL